MNGYGFRLVCSRSANGRYTIAAKSAVIGRNAIAVYKYVIRNLIFFLISIYYRSNASKMS